MVDRTIELEQALIAVIGAHRNSGGDVEKLMRDAQGLIIGHSNYRVVEHPYITKACNEIENAVNYKK